MTYLLILLSAKKMESFLNNCRWGWCLSIIFFTSCALCDNGGLTFTTKHIEHKAITDDITLSVYLPDKYGEASNHQTTYPVLYILDGDKYFFNGVAMQSSLTPQAQVPEMIVVGIEISKEKRRSYFVDNNTYFTDVLARKIIKMVDVEYRTKKQRLIFGWEVAGTFVLQLMVNQAIKFEGYISISPTQIHSDFLKLIKLRQNSIQKGVNYAYLGIAKVEFWSLDVTEKINELIASTSNRSGAFNWRYEVLESGNHYTTPLILFNRALLNYYSEYSPLRFYSIEEFYEFGGDSALKKHYQHRGQKYNESQAISKETIHYLFNQSVRENNIDFFFELAKIYPTFINQYYHRDSWFERYSKFLMRNDRHNEARQLVELGIKKFPSSEKIKVLANILE